METSSGSRTWRRAVGLACLAAFPFSAALVFIPPWRKFVLVPFTLGYFVPYIVVLGHLFVSPELSTEGKAFWRGALGVSWRSIPAVWTYLFAADLKRATAELRRPAS
jgi:hypothetical protein